MLTLATVGTIFFTPLILLILFAGISNLGDLAFGKQIRDPIASVSINLAYVVWAVFSTLGLVGFWGWALDGPRSFGGEVKGKRRLIFMIAVGMVSVVPLLSQLADLPTIRVMGALAVLGLLGGAYAIADIVRSPASED